MRCLEADEVVALFERRSSGSQRVRVTAHLEDCPACRELLGALASSFALTSDGIGSGTGSARRSIECGVHADGCLGRYRLLDILGAGSMGVVYRAHDPELRRDVALKLWRSRDTSRSAHVQLRNEAQVLARCAHPRVVHVYDVGLAGETQYLAMQLIDGVSLRVWLAQRRRTVAEILAVFVQAAEGLSAAHRSGVVHRDFKPDNVLVDRRGEVVVVDFGLAAVRDGVSCSSGTGAQTAAGREIAGTPLYMGPEQHRGEAADPRADQFAFCVALAEALYGQHPFGRADLHALYTRIMTEGPDLPRRSGVPRRMTVALARGLRAQPYQRYASMADLLAALRPRKSAAARRLVLPGVALAVAVPLLSPTDASDCNAAGTRALEQWQTHGRERLQAAYAPIVEPWGREVGSRVDAQLQMYVEQWVEASRESCTLARSPEEAAAFDARAGCLDRRWRELEMLLEVLESTGTEGLARGLLIAEQLDPPATCLQASSSAEPTPPHARHDEVVKLRITMTRARALLDAGSVEEAARLADVAARDATTVAWSPLVAEALVLRGSTLIARERWQQAEAVLREAVVVATAAGHDDASATAWRQLLLIRGNIHGEPRLVEADARFALAAAQRSGDRDHVLDVHLEAGLLFGEIADHERSRAHYLAARDLVEARSDIGDALSCRAMRFLGMLASSIGELEASVKTLERAVEICNDYWGEHHLESLTAVLNLATALGDAMEYERKDALDRTLVEKMRGNSTVPRNVFAAVLHSRGDTLGRLGRFEEALQLTREAVAVSESMADPPDPNLPRYLSRDGYLSALLGDADGAMKAHARALEIGESVYGLAAPQMATLWLGRGSSLYALGRLQEADAALARAQGIIEQAATPHPVNLLSVLHQRMLIAAAREHVEPARTFAGQVLALAQRHGFEEAKREAEAVLERTQR